MANNKMLKQLAEKTTKRRRNNGGGLEAGAGADFNNQDVKRRLGNFTTAGEHARQGGRTTGIVGQTKKTFRSKNRTKSGGKSK